MTLIESFVAAQWWVIIYFFLLATVLYVTVRAQRPAIIQHLCFFILSLVLFFIARLFDHAGMPNAMLCTRAAAIILQGMVVIGLVGVLLFGALVPLVDASLPRILQDVIVSIGQVSWVLIALNEHGVNLAGIIATSAVITAVIGLSMQDTLGNIVSGLAVQLDKSVQVGDWVKIDDISGRVVETRWRFTAIETRNWETVLIPNSVLSKTKVIVLGRRGGQPIKWRRWVWFNLDFRYAPSQVVEVVESAVRAAEIERVAEEPKPSCVAMEFADSYTRYAVRYWLTDLAADDPTDSEVRAHVYSALQRAGITLSMPAHAVFLTEETAQRKEQKAQHVLSDRVAALHRVRLFNALPKSELERLAQELVPAPFDRGDVMTRQGAEPHWLYLVVDGTAERFVENDDHQSTRVGDVTAGDVFGEWSLMTETKRETTVIATSKVNCYRLPKEAFKEALSRHPNLSEEIAGIIAHQRTCLEGALHHLDEEARASRHKANESLVMVGIKRLFGMQDPRMQSSRSIDVKDF